QARTRTDSGPQNRGRHGRGKQDDDHLGAGAQVRGEPLPSGDEPAQVDDAADAGGVRGGGEVARPLLVPAGEVGPAAHRVHQVVGDVHVRQRRSQGLGGQHVAPDDRHVGAPRVVAELLGRTGQAAHPVPGGEQFRDEPAADVAARPRDQDPRHAHPRPVKNGRCRRGGSATACGWRDRQYGLSYGRRPLNRPYMPNVSSTTPTAKTQSTFGMRRASRLYGVSSTARDVRPLSTNTAPSTMLTVEAKVPPTSAPPSSSEPNATMRKPTASVVETPENTSPSVVRNAAWSAAPSRPRTPSAPAVLRPVPVESHASPPDGQPPTHSAAGYRGIPDRRGMFCPSPDPGGPPRGTARHGRQTRKGGHGNRHVGQAGVQTVAERFRRPHHRRRLRGVAGGAGTVPAGGEPRLPVGQPGDDRAPPAG